MNQPALRTSSGAVWLITATIFTAVCLVPLVAIIVTGGAAASVALIATVLLACLLTTMFIVRFTMTPGTRQLRWLAACMLSMAVVALIAMIVCVMIVWTSVRS
ncbi:hypothetical protein [Microbacterium sp.]|uniref:hypothetical protein n=1 Tax=Microbacterium sp. TaxID=51671 RepID=UPI002811421A|nr:hypothetical protein [Microbacterium sp.]